MDSVGYYLFFLGVAIFTTAFLLKILCMVSNYRVEKRKYIIFMFLILVLINYFSDILNIIVFKNIFTTCSFIIFIKYTSKLSYKESILAFLRLFVIVVVSEIINAFIFGYLMHVSLNSNFIFLLIKINGLIITALVSSIVVIIKNKLTGKIMKINISWILVASVFTLLITVGALNYISTFNRIKSVYYLFLAVLLFIVLGLYSMYKMFKKDYARKLEINNLKSKNNEVIKYINEFKTYNHNLKYDLMAIKRLGNNEVNKYIDELLNNNKNELEYINNFKEVPSNLIHVFSDCLTLNNDNNIEIIIKNSLKDKELYVDMNSYLQLNEIIGNCLTNAIEAVPENGGIIFVYFYETESNKYIKIANNYYNDIDLDFLGQINYSTKNRDSGFGLSSIFNGKENIIVKGLIINNLFEIIIKIPK